ncbi:MAG TPA: transglutaminase-like domain-containing protein, partial [Fimbriimonadaceae bacterium]|nr:transglutaminase-like domain-containing protein [Fimbriimonadaceae bacterium]
AEVDIQTGGKTLHKSLAIPTGGSIVDDPLELVVGGKATPGKKMTVFVLDPTTATFIKNEVVLVGPGKTTVKGSDVSATLVQIVDPRLTMNVYVDGKGELVKVDGPMGIEMYPETREVALANHSVGYKPSADLAFTTSLRPDKNIANPDSLTGLTLRITGRDLSVIPSDDHQTVKKQGQGWVVDLHPPKLAAAKPATIAEVGKQKPNWLKPTLDIPSDSPTFKDLSRKILKGETRVIPAALAIKSYVYQTMRPNAGIGVLRDASEVLSSKEGVCRDYAILTVTLMRSAGIPARLCSGVVNWQGNFYYHAWAEIWDGANWIGIDSTVPQKQLSAAHLKLADGNVEEAFAFTFLDKVKIDVLDIRRK